MGRAFLYPHDARTVAEAIVHDLFTNGAGETADRLVLTKDPKRTDVLPVRRDLGGWSGAAVRAIIEQHLIGEHGT